MMAAQGPAGTASGSGGRWGTASASATLRTRGHSVARLGPGVGAPGEDPPTGSDAPPGPGRPGAGGPTAGGPGHWQRPSRLGASPGQNPGEDTVASKVLTSTFMF